MMDNVVIGTIPFCKWASLAAEMVKNMPVMQKTWVLFLG